MSKKPAPAASAAPAATKEAKPAASESASSTTSTPESGAATSETSSSPKKSSGSSRPISYFSSVSTDEYRAGWDSIFGGKSPKPPAAKRKSRLPVSFQLDIEELAPEARSHIEDLLSRKARKKRLNFAKMAEENTVTITINCEISD